MSRSSGKFIQDNAFLIAGLVLPFLLIILFAIARILPAETVPDPQYKALYALQPYYGSGAFVFDVTGEGKLSIEFKRNPSPSGYPPDVRLEETTLYLFDGAKNEVKSFDLQPPKPSEENPEQTYTVSDLTNLTLRSGDAPDGYTYRPEGYSRSSLITDIFSYNSHQIPAAIIKNGRAIPLKKDTRYGNLTFIGWVTAE